MTKRNDKSFSVRVNFERILQTIAARIYDTEYAFLRENVQNAIDAIRIQALRDKQVVNSSDYRIDIVIENNTCSIVDNGTGMNRMELEKNFWTMGSSGKNNEEARKAGCIGTFGIGGFANFGVCETVEVISKSANCQVAQITSLSKSSFSSNNELPKVKCEDSSEISKRGTIVRGIRTSPFNKQLLINYIKEYVQFVKEPIYIDGKLVSQQKISGPKGNLRTLSDIQNHKCNEVTLKMKIMADDANSLITSISSIELDGTIFNCDATLKLQSGSIHIYKKGFRICPVNISSVIGATGYFDSDIFQPTAGRDSLDSLSLNRLSKIIKAIELIVSPIILSDMNLLNSHIRMLPTFINQGKINQLGLLNVTSVDNKNYTLEELKKFSQEGKRIFYTFSNNKTAVSDVLTARGHVIIRMSSSYPRRQAEEICITRLCQGEKLDGFLDCLEVYSDLDRFEKIIITELDFVIRKLFNPSPYKFITGKLSLDAPIYWSNKKEVGKTIVYLDTRHGEFQKLKPLGYSTLLTSLIEAFCREYLSDTLKRHSAKFFGSGAINFDSYTKSHAELWELLASDIEISRLSTFQPETTRRNTKISVMYKSDIKQVRINQKDIISNTEKKSSKILRIIDERNEMGLSGYYIRLPQHATEAFGDLIKTFPSFAVVWFANRITWQVSDLKNSAFLFDITLDKIITSSKNELAHDSKELSTSKIHSYSNSLYLYVPEEITNFIIPKDNKNPVKIEIRHELVDIEGARSWTSKENKAICDPI